MPDSDDADGRYRTLGMIARVLDVSVDTLFEPPPGTQDGANSAEQEAQLLGLFRQIADARTRERCLDFLRCAVGKRSDG